MEFLIYKFRRRQLSAYEEIESFLQLQIYNHLSPIRYSYSDVKKMTRNFREKLDEGGFGSVYKGKLQSGYYVAVKLLGKAKINDKDFINDIGTIGKIHHVNVVQLVGYCAERLKRGLILDFMPNGSLDKYGSSSVLIPYRTLSNEIFQYDGRVFFSTMLQQFKPMDFSIPCNNECTLLYIYTPSIPKKYELFLY